MSVNTTFWPVISPIGRILTALVGEGADEKIDSIRDTRDRICSCSKTDALCERDNGRIHRYHASAGIQRVGGKITEK